MVRLCWQECLGLFFWWQVAFFMVLLWLMYDCLIFFIFFFFFFGKGLDGEGSEVSVSGRVGRSVIFQQSVGWRGGPYEEMGGHVCCNWTREAVLSGPRPGGARHHPPHPFLRSQGHPGPQLQRLPQVTLTFCLLPVALLQVARCTLASSLLNQPFRWGQWVLSPPLFFLGGGGGAGTKICIRNSLWMCGPVW